MDNNNFFEKSVVDALFENGLMGIEIGSEYGGSECNFMTTMLVVEELSKVDPSVAALVDIHNTLVNNLVMKVANKKQKEKYLPMLAQQCSGSFALTEPYSGSDAFALKTTAKKDGNDYIINGTKMWISNSDLSGVFLVMANVNPSAVIHLYKYKVVFLSFFIFIIGLQRYYNILCGTRRARIYGRQKRRQTWHSCVGHMYASF